MFEEHENFNMHNLDDDKVFHIEERNLIIDLHTKLSELKHKILSEKESEYSLKRK